MQQDIRIALQYALETIGISVGVKKILIEYTGDLKNGDFASSVALQYTKGAGMAPRAFAEKLVAMLGTIKGVQKIEVAGPGFINFYFESGVFAEMLHTVVDKPEEWGKNDAHKGEKIMVEYTDPNPFKEFHIGHLMSNAIGESIARLLEYSGAEVRRANYQGDVGPHVAKAIWAIQKLGLNQNSAADLGKAYAGGAAAYEHDEAAKVEIDRINAEVYDRSNPVVNSIYDAGRATSLRHFEELYAMLGTKFDHYFFESETAPRGLEIVRKHGEVFEESDLPAPDLTASNAQAGGTRQAGGAIVYKGENDGLHTRVFITQKGLPTYETKDLGLAELKQEKWPFDLSITVTAHEQAGYFAVVLAAMRKVLPEIAAKIRHVSHGMMRLARTATVDGFAEGKMSSRTGNVITGESLMEDVAEAARARATDSRADNPEKLAKDVAVGAIKYQILKQTSGKDIIFDRDRALSLEGDSGPYLQYSYARAMQVVAKAAAENITPRVDPDAGAIDLVRLMYRFPAAVERAAEAFEPHLVTNFLIEFAAAFNRWYAEVRIVDGDDAPQKVAITAAVAATLKNGLYLLGIPTPERM